ncbi:prostaglandin reductase 1-like, partial [Paramuricea clavata]
ARLISWLALSRGELRSQSRPANKIYQMMIVPIVTYSGTIKLLYTRTQLEKLGSIEKRAKEIIGSEISIPSTYLHKLMKMKACMIVKKCLVNDICSNFCGYFQVNNHDKGTRNSAILVKLPKVKLEFNRQAFRFAGAKIYNELPIENWCYSHFIFFFIFLYCFNLFKFPCIAFKFLLTAYFGVLNILAPKEGQTLYVNSAAGAVGAIVGQIAKIKGCRVVGSAGSDEKVAYCKSLGFDEVFNYKTVTSVEDALKEACPNGIDMFFENVGGPGFSKVIKLMNRDGRVAVCGAIATYNAKEPAMLEDFLGNVIRNRLKIQGFTVALYEFEYPVGRKELVQWIKEGKIKIKEHITNGFENLPKALIELFTGSNFGKAVVIVSSS